MKTPPLFDLAKVRHRRKRRAVGSPPPPPPPAGLTLLAVDALVVIGPELEMNLVFDVTGADVLNDVSAADPTKWTARYQGEKYVGSILGNVVADTLYLQMTPAGAEAGPDVLSYANAPSDVGDSAGRQLAAFSGFPI
jgi:hypothetical protein